MKTIRVGSYLTVELNNPDPDQPERSLVGALVESRLKDGNIGEDHPFNLMMDAIESLVLGHACAGIDVGSEAYIEGLETALNACANNV